jgi:Leucine-rich repeat (LRR) protein
VDSCKMMRSCFKKKLFLESLELTYSDVPVKDVNGTALGSSLHTLSLSGNPLSTVSPALVTCLSSIKILNLSHCNLDTLPEHWKLPKLKHLDLSRNHLTDFPHEVCSLSIMKCILDFCWIAHYLFMALSVHARGPYGPAGTKLVRR